MADGTSGTRCQFYDQDSRQRCTLDAPHIGRDHEFRPKEAGPMVGRIARMPSCKACGTSVAEGQRFCETCAEQPRNQPPKATIATTNQGRPPYLDKGSFRPLSEENGG